MVGALQEVRIILHRVEGSMELPGTTRAHKEPLTGLGLPGCHLLRASELDTRCLPLWLASFVGSAPLPNPIDTSPIIAKREEILCDESPEKDMGREDFDSEVLRILEWGGCCKARPVITYEGTT